MKKLSVFIMAQGQGNRWHKQNDRHHLDLPLPIYKQCLPVGPEPLIVRTQRLLVEGGIPPAVVRTVAPWELFADTGLTGISLPEPGPLLEGIAQCLDATPWADEIVFLMGDVLFSKRTLAASLEGPDLRFVGRLMPNRLTGKAAPELFSLRVAGREILAVRRIIRTLTRRGEIGPKKLWSLWDAIVNPATLDINDYTDDVDSPEEYLAFWPSMRYAALADV
jgi:hypothetical protein